MLRHHAGSCELIAADLEPVEHPKAVAVSSRIDVRRLADLPVVDQRIRDDGDVPGSVVETHIGERITSVPGEIPLAGEAASLFRPCRTASATCAFWLADSAAWEEPQPPTTSEANSTSRADARIVESSQTIAIVLRPATQRCDPSDFLDVQRHERPTVAHVPA